MSICSVCEETVTVAVDTIACYGPCKGIFHQKCASLTKTAIKMIAECNNVHWYCNECNQYSIKAVASTLNALSVSVQKLTDANKLSIEQHTPSPSLKLTLPSFADTASKNKRRRLDGSTNATGSSSPLIKRNVVVGSIDDDSAAGPKAVEPRKTVVISQFHPSTTAEDLQKYILEKLQIQPETSSGIRCNILIPAGLTLENLDFVGFKVSFPESHYDSIMCSSIWAKGITLRDFINRPRARGRQLGAFLPKITLGSTTPSGTISEPMVQ